MKKAVFWATILAMAGVFESVSPGRVFNADQSLDVISATLDGFSSTQANAMVALSAGSVDNSPQDSQVWFSRDVVLAWYNLLKSEKSANSAVDGFRIYFTRSLVSKSTPLHYNNRLIVVSTFGKDTVENGVHIKMHEDYFLHSKTDPLFQLNDRRGTVYNDKDATNGALLYNTCNCDITQPCETSSPHDIQRSLAEMMVQHFHRIIIFRKGAINSHAEWFDFNTLETLNTRLNESTPDNIPFDGIRVYFSRGVDNDYTYKMSKFVIVTTRCVSNCGADPKIHTDYFDCKHPALINKIRALPFHAEDNGELCPDHCDGLQLPSM